MANLTLRTWQQLGHDLDLDDLREFQQVSLRNRATKERPQSSPTQSLTQAAKKKNSISKNPLFIYMNGT